MANTQLPIFDLDFEIERLEIRLTLAEVLGFGSTGGNLTGVAGAAVGGGVLAGVVAAADGSGGRSSKRRLRP